MILPNVSYCSDNHKVYYNPLPIHNGHEYVDLGLPSGTKWAKMNVGANSETDYGLYFAWGETTGYADASTKAFSWSDYKYGTSSNLTKYNANDNKTHLELTDDAAAANMGGDWHMPTKEQCDELLNTEYVTNTWVTDYNGSGINGRLFTSVSNGNTMFVPAAGRCEDGGVYYVGLGGSAWASALGSGDVEYAWYFYFGSGGAGVYDSDYRSCGQSVRGVLDEPKKIINFTIGDKPYQAENGMTWEQWVNSKYNINKGYVIYKSGVYNSNLTGAINNVTSQDVIVINREYTLSPVSGGVDE